MNLVTALRKGCFVVAMLFLSLALVERSNAATSFRIVPDSSTFHFNTQAGVVDSQSITIENLTASPLTVALSTSGSSVFSVGT